MCYSDVSLETALNSRSETILQFIRFCSFLGTSSYCNPVLPKFVSRILCSHSSMAVHEVLCAGCSRTSPLFSISISHVSVRMRYLQKKRLPKTLPKLPRKSSQAASMLYYLQHFNQPFHRNYCSFSTFFKNVNATTACTKFRYHQSCTLGYW
jgi:hypothetical protein